MNLTTTDHEAQMDALFAGTFRAGAAAGVNDAAAFLRALGQREAAAKLIQYHQTVVNRTAAAERARRSVSA